MYYIDDMVDDYVSWREACAAVAVSYQNWNCSARSDQKLAFSVYIAALDREEQAATGYQRARTGRDSVGGGLTQLRCSGPGELDAACCAPQRPEWGLR